MPSPTSVIGTALFPFFFTLTISAFHAALGYWKSGRLCGRVDKSGLSRLHRHLPVDDMFHELICPVASSVSVLGVVGWGYPRVELAPIVSMCRAAYRREHRTPQLCATYDDPQIAHMYAVSSVIIVVRNLTRQKYWQNQKRNQIEQIKSNIFDFFWAWLCALDTICCMQSVRLWKRKCWMVHSNVVVRKCRLLCFIVCRAIFCQSISELKRLENGLLHIFWTAEKVNTESIVLALELRYTLYALRSPLLFDISYRPLAVTRSRTVANLSSMEMFDVGPTLGASIAHLSRTEIPWVGFTSAATVANMSNIECIWSGRQYCTIVTKLRSRNPTLDKRVARSCQKMRCKLGYRLFLHTILCQHYLP